MHHLHSTKISLSLFFVFLLSTAKAQYSTSSNLPDHDDKPYYFGIILGRNTSYHKLTYHPSFRNELSKVGSIQSSDGNGVQLGLHANLQLSRRFDLRFYPLNLIFANQKLTITDTSRNPNLLITQPNTIDEPVKLNETIMSFPLQIRFKSDRINNFRFYSVAGIKYDILLNYDNFSKITSIPFKPSDFGIETGIGFQFFFPYFILSPELKYSYGMNNVHSRAPQDQYSSLINKISNRMILFSLHFEGGIFNTR
jgi:hypothetical protein